MAQRFYKIIVAFALSFGICQNMRGQSNAGEVGQQPHVHTDSVSVFRTGRTVLPGWPLPGSLVMTRSPQLVSSSLLSPSLYSDHLGFFCREEWRWEKHTGIPFRFRLGSKAYVDYLEGK